jgi:hypothetical protein
MLKVPAAMRARLGRLARMPTGIGRLSVPPGGTSALILTLSAAPGAH